jgi:hypothetical protein
LLLVSMSKTRLPTDILDDIITDFPFPSVRSRLLNVSLDSFNVLAPSYSVSVFHCRVLTELICRMCI